MIITALYAGLLGLLLIVLTLRVALYRKHKKIALGHSTDHVLERRVRAHGNLVEYAPFALLQLLLLELLGAAPLLLHFMGGSFLLGRLLHAYGLSQRSGPSFGRVAGSSLSWLAILMMAILLLAEAGMRLWQGG